MKSEPQIFCFHFGDYNNTTPSKLLKWVRKKEFVLKKRIFKVTDFNSEKNLGVILKIMKLPEICWRILEKSWSFLSCGKVGTLKIYWEKLLIAINSIPITLGVSSSSDFRDLQ